MAEYDKDAYQHLNMLVSGVIMEEPTVRDLWLRLDAMLNGHAEIVHIGPADCYACAGVR